MKSYNYRRRKKDNRETRSETSFFEDYFWDFGMSFVLMVK